MLTLRRYQQADHDAVWQLHVLGLQSVGAYAGHGQWDDDLHNIEQVYLNNRGTFLVSEDEGRIVAMGALRYITNERAEIKRMRVHPDVRGRGFGQEMLQALETEAIALGYTTLFLDTSTLQIAAQHLYRKNGFRETGETKVMRGFTDIFFEKSIQ